MTLKQRKALYRLIAICEPLSKTELEKPSHNDCSWLSGTVVLGRPIIVGHSWGAAVALHYAVVHADNVTALVLVDGATNQFSLRPNWSREQAIQALAPPRFAGTPRETFFSYYPRGPLGEQWTAELEESILQIVYLREDDTVAPRLDFEHHLQIIGAMWDQPLFDLYRQVRCPLKLIVA